MPCKGFFNLVMVTILKGKELYLYTLFFDVF